MELEFINTYTNTSERGDLTLIFPSHFGNTVTFYASYVKQFAYDRWNTNAGEPEENNLTDKKCARIHVKKQNQWHDNKCREKYAYICKQMIKD